MIKRRHCLQLLLVLAACGSASAQPERIQPERMQPERMQPETQPRLPNPDATPMSGRWEGSYVCGQGLTGLSLQLVGHEDGTLEGIFEFSALPENPEVPSGSYRVHGRVSPGWVVILEAGEWLIHPPEYVTVPLVGRVVADPVRIHGFVDDPLCDTFSVEFVEAHGQGTTA
jgi:hypothetical protein